MTSELHDSYFRLMRIKHAIPKIEWAIEWAIELSHNSVRQEVSELEVKRVGVERGRESHHPSEGALGTPDGVWRPDQLVIRWGRESLHPVEWASGPPVEQPWRTRKTQR